MATRQAIVRAALESFSDLGYAATSMRDIARVVGIQPASIYSHFPSKEEILWFAYREAMDTLATMQAEEHDESLGVVAQLGAFVRTHARFHATYHQLAQVSNSQMVSLSAEHYSEATRWRDAYEQSLREMLRLGVEQGVMVIPDLKVYSYAILQMGMAIATWYRPEGTWTPEAIAERYEEIAMRMLGVNADANPGAARS